MRRAVALLAAVLLLAGVAGCGGDGAEPGVPKGAAVVLDFTPNAVHSGLYAAQARGLLPRRRDRPDDPPAGRIDRRAEAARRRAHRVRDPRHPRPRDRPRARLRTGRRDAAGAAPAGRRDRPPRNRRPLAPRTAGPDRRRHRPALRRSGGRLRGQRRRRRPGQGRRGDDRLQRGLGAGGGKGRRRDRLLERRGGDAAAPGNPDPDLQGQPHTALPPTRS